ncbi:MAG: hypothetical protein ACXACF_10760 [Candidatus Hermodarchaeia archaeon]
MVVVAEVVEVNTDWIARKGPQHCMRIDVDDVLRERLHPNQARNENHDHPQRHSASGLSHS